MSGVGRRQPPQLPPLSAQPWANVRKAIEDHLRWSKDNYSGIPGGFKTSDPSAVEIGDAADPGAESAGWAAADHVHSVGTPTAPPAVAATAAAGSSTTPARQDHTHRLGIVSAKGDSLTHDGTNPVREAVGANDTVLMADSGQTTGRIWRTVAALIGKLLTTKGDIVAHDGSTAIRRAAGTDGEGLVYEASQTSGIRSGNPWKGARTKALTNTAAGSVFEVALPAGGMCAGVIRWAIRCTDGTDYQVLSGVTSFVAVNKAGAYTSDVDDQAPPSSALSAGTLTAAWSVLSGTDKVTLQMTATSSLTPTTLEVRLMLDSLDGQTITFL